MRALSSAFAVLLMASAMQVRAAEAPGETKIVEAYRQIHEHVCGEVGQAPCPPALVAAEKWAFVKTWCGRQGKGDDVCKDLPEHGGPVVIAFDHDARAWRPVHGVAPGDLETNANGVPTVLTGHGRAVVAVVESTNPLVYKAEAGAITETDASVVADIKKLFEKLGPVLAQNFAQAEGVVMPGDGDVILAVTEAAKKIIDCIPDQWARARRFTQRVEDRENADYTLLAKDCPSEPSTIDAAVERLQAAATALKNHDFCAAEVARLTALLDLTPTDVKALREARKGLALRVDCERREGLLGLVEEIDERLASLEKAEDAATKSPTQPNADGLAARRQEWRGFSVQKRQRLAPLAAMAKSAAEAAAEATALSTKEKRAELEKIAASIKRFDERLVESAASSAPITDRVFRTKDVADFFVVRQGSIQVTWTKTRSRTLTITKASAFEGLTTRRPDSVATGYGAGSLAADLVDMNVALTYTPLTSPVFGMVSEPAPTAADPNARRNVIQQTDEEARSGKLGVLVSLPVFLGLGDSAWTRRFGLESMEIGESTAAEDVRIAIAVEETEVEARVALRVRKRDASTERVIDDMRVRGLVPEDVEVDEVGPLFGFGPRDLVSPLQPGVSCAHQKGARGTVGCILRRGGELLFLSANHVLARENRAQLNEEIVQPALQAPSRRTVATLLEFEALAPIGNLMDAAVARITVADVSPVIFNGRRIIGIRTAPLAKGDRVFKFGQSTEERSGSVLSTTISNVKLEMDFGDYTFDQQIEVESKGSVFSCSGDSGALVYDENDLAVGIVIGGNCVNRTYVTPIGRLLSRFGATLA